MTSDVVELKARHLVSLCDRDHNGLLEVDDFEDWVSRLAAIRGWEPGSEEYAGLQATFVGSFKAMQAAHGDDDGQATVDDMTADLIALARSGSDALNTWAAAKFEIIDANADGMIGPDEYADLMASVGIDRAAAGAAFERLDLDGDGSISREEFEQLYVEYLTSDDPDAPGSWLWGWTFSDAAVAG